MTAEEERLSLSEAERIAEAGLLFAAYVQQAHEQMRRLEDAAEGLAADPPSLLRVLEVYDRANRLAALAEAVRAQAGVLRRTAAEALERGC